MPKGGSGPQGGGHWGVIHSPVTNFPPASLQVPPPHRPTTPPLCTSGPLLLPPSLYSTPPPTPPSLQSTPPPSQFHPAFQQPPFFSPPPLPTPTLHLQDSSAPSHTFSFHLAPQHPCISPALPRPLYPVPTGTCKPSSLQLPPCHPQASLHSLRPPQNPIILYLRNSPAAPYHCCPTPTLQSFPAFLQAPSSLLLPKLLHSLPTGPSCTSHPYSPPTHTPIPTGFHPGSPNPPPCTYSTVTHQASSCTPHPCIPHSCTSHSPRSS